MAKLIKYTSENGLKAEFLLDKWIGRGAYGEVFICSVLNADPELGFPTTVACKKVTARYEEEFEEMKEREIKVWSISEGKNIIRLYAAVIIDRDMYFFFHFYNGGMLSDLIKAKGKLEEKLAAKIIEQLLKGLIELHKKGYVHRDIKPDNVILHFDWMDPNMTVPEDFLKDWDYLKQSCFSSVLADLGKHHF